MALANSRVSCAILFVTMNKAKIEAMKNCLANFTRMHLEGVCEIVIYDKQGR